jgi:FkbM family methyltransferase
MKLPNNNLRYLVARSIPKRARKYVPEIIYKHLYFTGPFDLYFENKKIGKLQNTSSIIENQIFWRGLEKSHEPISILIWLKLLQQFKPSRVLDIGANSGIYGILSKLICPNSEIHFFEPSVECNFYIQETLRLNNHVNGFMIHNVALSDQEHMEKSFVATPKSGVPYTYVGRELIGVQGEFRETKVVRLDSFFNQLSLKEFQFVKMDIEGHEPQALEGFGELLKQEFILLIEILDDLAALQVSKFFLSDDFVFYNIDDDKGKIVKQGILTKSYKYNFLIIPKKISQKVDFLISGVT